MSAKLFKNYPTEDYSIAGDNRDIQTIKNIMLRAKIRDAIKNNTQVYYDYPMVEMQTPQEIADKMYGDPNLFWIVFMMNDVVDPYYDLGLSNRQLERYIDKKYPGQYYNVQTYSGDILVSSTLTGVESGAVGEVLEWDPSRKKIVVEMRSGTFKLAESLTSVKVHNGVDITGQVLLGSITRLNKFAVHHWENTETGEWVDQEDYTALPIGNKREVDNFTHETELNEKKRVIKLLKAEYVSQVVGEIENILRR